MPNGYNPGSEYTLTSGYGRRFNDTDFHSGIDYGAEEGTDVRTASGGEVVFSTYNRNYGNTVIIKYTREGKSVYYSLYAHMNGKDMPELGAEVEAGDKIGEVGNTGRVKDRDPVTGNGGEHLHFEVLVPRDYESDRTPFFYARDGITKQYITDSSAWNDPDRDDVPNRIGSRYGSR